MNARSCSMKEIYKLIYRKEMLLLATALNLFPNNSYFMPGSRYTNADLKTSPYDFVHIKIIP